MLLAGNPLAPTYRMPEERRELAVAAETQHGSVVTWTWKKGMKKYK